MPTLYDFRLPQCIAIQEIHQIVINREEKSAGWKSCSECVNDSGQSLFTHWLHQNSYWL